MQQAFFRPHRPPRTNPSSRLSIVRTRSSTEKLSARSGRGFTICHASLLRPNSIVCFFAVRSTSLTLSKFAVNSRLSRKIGRRFVETRFRVTRDRENSRIAANGCIHRIPRRRVVAQQQLLRLSVLGREIDLHRRIGQSVLLQIERVIFDDALRSSVRTEQKALRRSRPDRPLAVCGAVISHFPSPPFASPTCSVPFLSISILRDVGVFDVSSFGAAGVAGFVVSSAA